MRVEELEDEVGRVHILRVVPEARHVEAARPAERTLGTEVTRFRYRGCDPGTDVELYAVANGGHTWPGSLDVARLGHTTQDVNAADLILEFFDTHRLRRT